MDISQSEEWSGTITELRAVVRAKIVKDTGVRVAPRASTVKMDAHLMGNQNPSLLGRRHSTMG